MSTSTSRGYHHGDLRRALVSAALELLREGGAEAATLRASARRAGVSAMAPYRHFPDKRSLLAAVASYGFGVFRDRLAAADATASGPDALVVQGVAYVLFAWEEPALFRLMFGAAQPPDFPELHRVADEAYAVLAGRVAATVDEGDREDLALAAWSVVHGLACLLVDGQVIARDREEVARLAERVARRLVARG